jgi:ABC-type molybdate transport system substrate-binding protein
VITRRRALSLGIAAAALTLASAPLPGLRRPLLVAVGSELEQPLQQLVPLFERRHPGIDLRWQVQGAQDMVNQNQEGRPDRARVLIPSNREQLQAFQAENWATWLGLRGRYRTDSSRQALRLLVVQIERSR